MANYGASLLLLLIALLNVCVPFLSSAEEFAIVGPRAMGMGGAGVAVTSDSLATYWNPAGLAMSRTVDVRIQGGIQAVDRQGVLPTVKDIRRINLRDTSARNINRLQGLVDKLNQSAPSGSAIESGGIYVKGYWGDIAFGMNVSDVVTAGEFLQSAVSVNNTGTRLNVNGQIAIRGLEARQAAFSSAYTFADGTFAIGATFKLIQGAAYTGLVNPTSGDAAFPIGKGLGKAHISTAVGTDVGAMFRPTSWVRVGVVGKNLNAPSFAAPDGSRLTLGRQVRAGVAVNPYSSLTLTVDGDLTSNQTWIPGLKSRVVSGGAEHTWFGDILALRLGALKNVEDAKSIVTPTAGLSLRVFTLQIDIGGGYDFRQRQALASGSIAMTF